MIKEMIYLVDLGNAISLEDIAVQLSTLNTMFQALGGLIILYIIFSIVSAIISRKKAKEIQKINENLEDIKKLLRKNK